MNNLNFKYKINYNKPSKLSENIQQYLNLLEPEISFFQNQQKLNNFSFSCSSSLSEKNNDFKNRRSKS